MAVELALGDILSHGGNRIGSLAIERSKLPIDLSGGALDHTERPHDLNRHPLGSNAEIMQRTLSLRSPEPICRNLQRSECVALSADLGGFVARFGHEIR